MSKRDVSSIARSRWARASPFAAGKRPLSLRPRRKCLLTYRESVDCRYWSIFDHIAVSKSLVQVQASQSQPTVLRLDDRPDLPDPARDLCGIAADRAELRRHRLPRPGAWGSTRDPAVSRSPPLRTSRLLRLVVHRVRPSAPALRLAAGHQPPGRGHRGRPHRNRRQALAPQSVDSGWQRWAWRSRRLTGYPPPTPKPIQLPS